MHSTFGSISVNCPALAPLISVVIATRNRPAMLSEAIASVKAQTFTDYEIIVVSNGEAEDSRQESCAIAATHGCLCVELPEGNVSIARNAGIEHASGEWICFLDDDDLWLPNTLERQVAEARRTGADLLGCDYVEFFPDGTEIVRQPRLIEGWPFVKATSHIYWSSRPSGTMGRKCVFEQVGGFDPRLRYGEDNDIWRRIAWRHRLHHTEETLVRIRMGHPSLTQHMRARCLHDIYHYLKMRRDTPDDLRWALPAAAVVIPARLLAILMPTQFLFWLRPRTRWIQFRRWFRSARPKSNGGGHVATSQRYHSNS